MGKFNWPTKLLSTNNLVLDDENPRLPDFLVGDSTQKDIIEYLIKNEKVKEIADSICEKSYLHNEMPYVYKNSKNKYVVLEGNRRVTACKVLLNNKLAPSSSRKYFEGLGKKMDLEEIKKIRAIVCPSREEADILIESRHTNNLMENWDAIKKARFYYRKIQTGSTIEELQEKFSSSNIKKLLMQYFIYEEALKMDFDDTILDDIKNEKKFKITNFERFYSKKSGRNFLGITFNDNGTFNRNIPEEEYNKRFKHITREVLNGNIDSRKLNKAEQVDDYVKQLYKKEIFDSSINPDPSINVSINSITTKENTGGKSSGKNTSTNKNTKPARKSLIQPGYNHTFKNQRINDVFTELKTLSFAKRNSIALNFRSFLEMITYQYLYKNNKIEEIKKENIQDSIKDTDKKKAKINEYLNIVEGITLDFNDSECRKVFGVNPSQGGNNHSLMAMLGYLSKKGEEFIPDKKLIRSLKVYLKQSSQTEDFITHYNLNLLVHSEYKPTPTRDELIQTWDNLFPLIEYMINDVNS